MAAKEARPAAKPEARARARAQGSHSGARAKVVGGVGEIPLRPERQSCLVALKR